MPTDRDTTGDFKQFTTDNNKLRNVVQQDIKDLFPIEGSKHKLEVLNTEIPKQENRKDFKKQLDEIDKGGTFSENIYGDVRLVDQESGEIVDEKRKKLAELPIETNRGTFIVGGKEYSVPKLFKLRPGVFHKKDNKGRVKSQFNLKQGTGSNFNIEYRPEKNQFKLITSYPKRTFDAYPLLSASGISDEEMQERWGGSVLDANKKGKYRDTLNKFYRVMNDGEDPEGADVEGFAKDFVQEGEFDPIVTRNTLGEGYEQMEPEAVLDSTERLINIAKGEEEPDDRDSIMFKSLSDPVDLMDDRLKDWSTENQIKSKVYRNLNQKKDINKILRTDIINDPIEKFFTTSQISELPEQTNPIDFTKQIDKVTALGEGALQDTRNVPSEARGLNPTELGFIDPIVTPESEKTGLVTHMAFNSRIDEDTKDLKTEMYSTDEGEAVEINPREAKEATISFADQFQDKDPSNAPKKDKVKAMDAGTITMVEPDKVDYVIDDPKSMLSMESMLVPFLSADQGNRTQMATKMFNQALPLKDRESPNVQTKFDGEKTTEEVLGERMVEKARGGGTVKEVNEDEGYIDIDYGSEEVRHHMYNNFPLNRESFLDSELKVSEGDEVSEGDLLFDTNFTKDGELAIGKNLKVGYVPMKNRNFEDAVVASESAAEKLTAEKIKTFEVPKGDEVQLDKETFVAHFPDKLESEKLDKLDEKGLPQEGNKIEKGEPVDAYLKEREITQEEAALGKFHKKLLEPWMDNVDEWKEDNPGVVDKVVEKPDKYEIRVKTERPAERGTKVAGRHGQKGVLGEIIPDSEMPKDEDGEPIDILQNPHGVVSRLNIGQLYENAAGKIADSEKSDLDKFKVEQFDDENYKELIERELDKNNIDDKEVVTDPKHGELNEKVTVGNQHMMVLDHDPRDKFSARAYDDPYTINMTPQSGKEIGGQNIGPLAFNSMLAHGARKNLHEMSTYKSSKNPEFWRAIETGDAIPSPEPSFPWRKFANQLSAAGINVEKYGDKIKMLPMSDESVEMESSGEVETGQGVRAKDLAPISGGLFDSEVFGGMQGKRWGHVDLGEEMPNPMFEDAIKELADIDDETYNSILEGQTKVDKQGNVIENNSDSEESGEDENLQKAAQNADADTDTGAQGIKNLLEPIDVDNEIKDLEEKSKTQTGSDLNKSHRKLRYLKNIKDLGGETDDLFNDKWSVIPPQFRPVFPTEDGKLLESDLNLVYKDLVEDNNQLKEATDVMPEEQKGEMRKELYKDLKALAGVGDNSKYEQNEADGVLDIIAGRSPKEGFFQDKLLSRRQEQSGRAVANPGPHLSPDELEIPEKMSWKIFRPKIVRDLVRNRGYTPLEAREEVDNETETARQSLNKVAEDNPVLMNRAPSLHKFSIQAFKPKIKKDSHTIKMNPLINHAYNADFDGDSLFKNEEIFFTNVQGLQQTKIKNFPHGDKIKEEDNVEYYEVPEDIQAFGYDKENKEIKEYNVSEFSKHKGLDVVEVTFDPGTKSKFVKVSDDHSLFCLDPDTLEIEDTPPEEALGMFSPSPREIELPESKDLLESDEYGENLDKFSMDLPLDPHTGYFVGALCGDGYTTEASTRKNSGEIGFCGVEEDVREEIQQYMIKNHQKKRAAVQKSHHMFDGKECYSEKITWKCNDFSKQLKEIIGESSGLKQLPPFWIYGDEKFRINLLTGLIDTDGTVGKCDYENQDKKTQIQFGYDTTSEQLRDDIRMLMWSLGIRSSYSPYEYEDDGETKEAYRISISSTDMQKHIDNIELRHSENNKAYEYLRENPVSKNNGRVSRIPAPEKLVEEMKSFVHSGKNKTTYTQLYRAGNTGYINRPAYNRWKREGILDHIIEKIEDEGEEYDLLERWLKIAEADNIEWNLVESVDKYAENETCYDITVDDCNVFMVNNGIIVYDTLAVHAPMTQDAVDEAWDMVPSKNLYNPANNKIMLEIMHEANTGLSQLTDDEKSTQK